MIENFWIQVFVLAIFIDIVFGEPPAFLHPVVWIGKLIGFLVKHSPANHRNLYGSFMVLICTGIAVFAGVLISSIEYHLPGLVVAAYFLKSTFSIRMLLVSALGIKNDLETGKIEKVRSELRTFVGRDTRRLDGQQSASAVIESLAESFVDSILAPMFYFLLFGLPGAMAYRTINTLDSMVGYKKEPFIELGYFAARLDDIANLIPARISPLFIFIASVFAGKPGDSVRTCFSDHDKTASPNSGWSMSSVSGALNAKLEKKEYHIIGKNYPSPEPYMIKKAINIVGISSFLVISGIYFIGKVPIFRL